MEEHLFESWQTWWLCFMSGLKKGGHGMWRVLTSIFFGIVSLLVWLWRSAVSLVGRFPNIALGAFIVIACLVWVLTFVSMRVRAVGAEHQRDSVSWEYSQFKESHGYE